MARNENNKTKDKAAVEPEKSDRQRGQKKDKMKAPTKLVIRHLPPTMTEEEFLKQTDPLPEHEFYYFANADWSLGFDATCRAYITLKHYDDVFLFRDRFDGYVFVDSNGAEYAAIVEFAPFQGLIKTKSRRSDNKMNMIEQEEHYQLFLQKLEEDREAAAKGGEYKLEFSLDRKKEDNNTSTPLLQYLANKKEKRREEAKKRAEEKRRQREDEKKLQVSQVTKIFTGQDNSQKETKEATAVGTASSRENAKGEKFENATQEDRKNSRSKRRFERDRRRREEHEQRKKERERLEHERNDRASTKPEKKRDRNRNRKDKDKDKNRDKDKDIESNGKVENERVETQELIEESKTELTASKSIEEVAAIVGKGEKVSESVMHFIRSAVTAIEFVPRHKQDHIQQEQQKAGEQTEPQRQQAVERDKDPEEDKNQQKKDVANAEPQNNARTVKESKEETSARTTGTRQTQRQRLAEERRIRNKDRPSIVIYQPKPRLRLSEERDVSASKDTRSDPISDVENVKKEEPQQSQQRHKKVSRYSERRNERRSDREKQKSSESGDNQENCNNTGMLCSDENNKKELHKFKSQDDTSKTLSAPATEQLPLRHNSQ